MFKKIPGNKDYRINLKLEIIDYNGTLVFLEKDRQGLVSIELFGKIKKVSLDWLCNLSWYECDVIIDLQKHLNKIRFFPASKYLKIRCGHIMQFSEPIYYKQGFRYIPSFPRYAIDINGNILDTLENRSITERFEQDGYQHVYVYTPDRNANKHIRFHRLLALTWLPNIDFINSPIINHIDGNRSNNVLKNLEWCSYSENSKHALFIGLNDQSIKMKTRDVITGTIEIFNSVSELVFKLGLSKGYSTNSFLDRMPGFLFKKRYEIKRADDVTPWYYENNTFESDKTGKQYFNIKVLNKETGELKNFYKVRDFYKAFRIWGAKCLDDGIQMFKDRFKSFEISYQRNFLTGPYQVHNLLEENITVVKSIQEVSELTGIGENEINSDLRRKLKYIYSNKWIIVAGLEIIDKNDYRNKPNSRTKVLIINKKDGVELIAQSVKEAARLTGIMPATINLKLKNGEEVKCFNFRTLE